MEKTYLAIDLKSFYASAECVFRHLDPLTTNLVVADASRTEKTICLAVSPSLKALGIPGRPRLFEVVQAVKKINLERLSKAPGHRFDSKSVNSIELNNNPSLELDYVIATPQMAKYMAISRRIYSIYLRYISSSDIHVYSIDEVFIDATGYLGLMKLDAYELAEKLVKEVLKETGITATAGIGTNLYLAKVAMDIVAKHMKPDKDGVRIAKLDEFSYRDLLWGHLPLTDFWRVGAGSVRRLNSLGLFTMGDVCRQSLKNEEILYKTFGINAELLIDHAWGYEPTTIKDIKEFRPENHSQSVGQVLSEGYEYRKALLIVKEMAEALSLDLVSKGLVCQGIGLAINYDKEVPSDYDGQFEADYYGRKVPKPVNGSLRFEIFTSSTKHIRRAGELIFKRLVDPKLLVRRVNIVAISVLPRAEGLALNRTCKQLNLFEDAETALERENRIQQEEKEEGVLQETLLDIKRKFGKNAVVKGMDLEEGATAIARNEQIGGHKA